MTGLLASAVLVAVALMVALLVTTAAQSGVAPRRRRARVDHGVTIGRSGAFSGGFGGFGA